MLPTQGLDESLRFLDELAEAVHGTAVRNPLLAGQRR